LRIVTKRIALLLVCLVAILVTAVHVAGQGPRQVTPEPPSVSGGLRSNDTTIVINQAMPAPAWALAERELLRLNAEGAAL
jgi:hypothetical protein